MTCKSRELPTLSVGLARKNARVAERPETPPADARPAVVEKVGGLVLSRHLGQSIMIGRGVEVEVVGIKSATARIRISAPREVAVHRREVFDAIHAQPEPAEARPSAPAELASEPDPAHRGQGGLVLTRHVGETIMIGDVVAVEVVAIRPGAVRLRVVAPREIAVHRREIFDAIGDGS